jgi:hypothetical protein
MNTLKTMTAAAALMLAAGAAQAQAPAVDARVECTGARVWRSDGYHCVTLATPYDRQCIWETYAHFHNDIDIMERCHAVTRNDVVNALGFLIDITARNGIGSTPFKDAHCWPTYSGYACEYKGITMQVSR